jgi:Tfp pilus assembly protein PilF
MRLTLYLAAAIATLPGTSFAASMVIGSGFGRMCFEAADSERANAQTLGICDRALSEEALAPDDRVATFVNRGILKARLGDFPGATADYDRALKLDPTEAEAYLNKGTLVLKTGQDAGTARTLFDSALAHGTRRPEIAHYGRAVAQEFSGDISAAYSDYRKAAELAPEWEQPKKELARFSFRKKG